MAFYRVLGAWKPIGGSPAVMLRWLVTEWCNYSCPYCLQDHRRDQDKGGGKTAHSFDNYPPETWLQALRRHFRGRRLSVTLSGGEPFLDRKAMLVLVNGLARMPNVECIRVDTNASWEPRAYSDLDRSKLVLNCSFHPGQVDEDQFRNKLESILASGFRVGIVNYVMSEGQFEEFKTLRTTFAAMGVVLNPNPDFNRVGEYPAEKRRLLEAVLPPVDYRFKVMNEKPQGKRCLYPAVAYELDARGAMNVGCFPDRKGSLFDDRLPALPRGPVPCPRTTCGCLDMYSFLEGQERNRTTDPLGAYAAELCARG